MKINECFKTSALDIFCVNGMINGQDLTKKLSVQNCKIINLFIFVSTFNGKNQPNKQIHDWNDEEKKAKQ